jgi:predicted transcriptional regulator
MTDTIMGADEVRAVLAELTTRQRGRLAKLSGVPLFTIDKIRRGETRNPGLETVRKFLPHIRTIKREAA